MTRKSLKTIVSILGLVAACTLCHFVDTKWILVSGSFLLGDACAWFGHLVDEAADEVGAS
jgi:hypothetical protein